jgi:hypothetical protein
MTSVNQNKSTHYSDTKIRHRLLQDLIHCLPGALLEVSASNAGLIREMDGNGAVAKESANAFLCRGKRVKVPVVAY